MNLIILFYSLCVPPIGIFGGLYGIRKNFRNWKTYIICVALSLAAIAYCYYPSGDPDLTRYFSYIEGLQNESLIYALNNGIKGETNTYVFSFFCWLAARIGDPHLIPAISTFFVYYFGLFVTCKVGEDINASVNEIIYYLLFIITSLNLYSIINNVRNVFVFTLISFAVFRDLYLRNRSFLTYFLYIIPIFIHQSAILLILVRIVFLMASRAKILILILVAGIHPEIRLAHNLISNIDFDNMIYGILKNFIAKADMYINDVDSAWGLYSQMSRTFRLERYIDIGFVIIVCLMVFSIVRFDEHYRFESNAYIRNLINYSFILGALTMSCATMLTPEYWRFYSVTALFSGPVYLYHSRLKGNGFKLLRNSIFIVSPFACLIWIRLISYSNLTKLLIYPFISSPFIVLFDNLFR